MASGRCGGAVAVRRVQAEIEGERLGKTMKRAGLLLAVLLAAAGCTQVPTVPEPPPPRMPEIVPVTPTPEPVAAAPVAEPEPAAEPPADLYERMRAGFVLNDVNNPAVTREAAWFAKHPEYLDRTFRRGERYLHFIVTEIAERNLPLELALLPVVESAFNPVALSRSRASGLWQFIPATGRRYGLKQNVYYDGRRDVIEATRAALDYLEFLADEFDGNWLQAIAAYNTGENNVHRAIERNLRAGKPTDFFSLQLPRETRAYVPKLLAIRRLVADPDAYGLDFAPIDNAPYFAAVDSGGQIDLEVAADLAGIEREEFFALNPAFLRGVTDPDGPHRLLVPVGEADAFQQKLADLPDSARVRVAIYRVRSGDTLGAIARRHHVSVGEIQASNRLHGTMIHPGQDLVINLSGGALPASTSVRTAQASRAAPAAQGGVHVVRRGETLWSIARQYDVPVTALAAENGMGRNETLSIGRHLAVPSTRVVRLASVAAPDPALQRVTYTVRRGDTLSRISRMFSVSVTELLAWNNLASAHRIKPGQRLVMYVDDASRAGG
jgi:peptidoglycan lytic transglycosylase D